MKQLLRMFGQDLEHADSPEREEELINYKRLSIQLGLHKESYNYLNKVQNINKENNMNKLRQLYQSIESPKKYRNDESFDNTDRPLKKTSSKNGHFSVSNLNNNDYYSNVKTISPYNNNNRARQQLKSQKGIYTTSLTSDIKSRLKSQEGQAKAVHLRYSGYNAADAKYQTADQMKRAQQVAIKDHIKILQKRNSYNGKQKEYINKLTD